VQEVFGEEDMSKERITPKDQLKPAQFEVNGIPITGGSLPAYEYEYEGQRYAASCWRLTDEQLKELTVSRSIWMQTVGSQPSVLLSIERPWSMDLADIPESE
jgi:hypothetical protein